MNRRNFLRFASCSGVALGMSALPWHSARADGNRYFINLEVGGGWDPTDLFDPKGNDERADGNGPVNNYDASNIEQYGNIKLAPLSTTLNAPANGFDGGVISRFFADNYADIFVVNGVDHATNNHGVGPRSSAAGTLTGGFPTTAALAAASWQPGMSNPYLSSNGLYTATSGLVPLVSLSETSRLADMSNKLEDYQATLGLGAKLSELKNARLSRQIAKESLPRRLKLMNELSRIRNGEDALANVSGHLDDAIENDPTQLKERFSLVAAAFAGGLSVGASVAVAHSFGLDTHSEHDANHTKRMGYVFDAINYLWQRLEDKGIAEQTTLMISSDFGRTPYYNGDHTSLANGKDHWPIGAYMFMGNGVNGNRVVGATDENYNQVKINPDDFSVDENSGLYLNTAHVINATRNMLSIDNTLKANFALGEANNYEPDLFNKNLRTTNA